MNSEEKKQNISETISKSARIWQKVSSSLTAALQKIFMRMGKCPPQRRKRN